MSLTDCVGKVVYHGPVILIRKIGESRAEQAARLDAAAVAEASGGDGAAARSYGIAAAMVRGMTGHVLALYERTVAIEKILLGFPAAEHDAVLLRIMYGDYRATHGV